MNVTKMKRVLFGFFAGLIGLTLTLESVQSQYFSQETNAKSCSVQSSLLHKKSDQNDHLDAFSALTSYHMRPTTIIVSGTLAFLFHPKASGGTDGSWQPIIISPSGIRCVGPVVSYDNLNPCTVIVNVPCDGYVETGYYSIELRNAIVNEASSDFLDSLSVEYRSSGSEYEWDTIRCLSISSSLEGENIVIPYLLPVPDQEHIE